MKVFEVLEPNEWQNTPFESKKAEMAFLERKRLSGEYHRRQLEDKLRKMMGMGDVIDEDTWLSLSQPANNSYVGVKGAGTGQKGWGKYYRYYVNTSSPKKTIVDKIDQLMRDIKANDERLRDRIKDLTVRGYSFCFTGFRDDDLERKIRALGGEVYPSARKGLSYLVAKDPHSNSGKMLKAKEEGAKIISRQQLEDMLRD